MAATERQIILNLKEAYKKPRERRMNVAIKILRKLIARYSKVKTENVKIDQKLSSIIFSSGKKIPRKIKVKITIDEKGVYATLPENS